MTHTDTSTEAVTPVAKEISGLASREAVSMVQGWEDAFELYHKAADQLLALASERDTLAKQVEDMGESYSKFADDYLKCAEKYQETVTLYSGAVEELSKLRAQLAEARNAALEEAAYQAKNACIVPPDGGSPTTEEIAVCDEAAARIRALKSKPASRAVSVQEAAKLLLNVPRSLEGPLAIAGLTAGVYLEDVECGGEITTEIIESFLRALAQDAK